MKKLLIAMLFAAVLIAQASPLRAQYSMQDALNVIINKLDSLGLYSSPPISVGPALSSVHRADTLKFSFDSRGFYDVQFRMVADSIPFDSATVYFCTSTAGLWTGGNVAAFDRDPSTAVLDGWKISGAAAGVFVPPRNIVLTPTDIYGNSITSPYIMGYITLTAKTHRIKNLSIVADCRY